MAAYGGYGAVNGSSAVSGSTTAPGRDFIDVSNTITADGQIESFDIYMDTVVAGQHVKLKVWRLNGANYDYIGQSETFDALSAGLNSGLTLASPITGVLTGDYIGIQMENWSGSTQQMDVDGSAGQTVKFKTGDATTNQAAAGFSSLSNFALCVAVYGSAGGGGSIVPHAQHARRMMAQ